MVDDLMTHGCQTGNNGSDDRDGSNGDEWEEEQNPCNVTVAVLAEDAQEVGPESHIGDLNQNKDWVHQEPHAEKAQNDANSRENEKDECWGAELLNILKNCHYVVGCDFYSQHSLLTERVHCHKGGNANGGPQKRYNHQEP